MAQRSLAWTEIRVGLLVLASFLLLAIAIFSIGGDSGIFSKKITITGYFPDANGLREGAEVWLEGVMIGNVRKVTLAKQAGPDHNVDVVMRLDAEYGDIIRTDSTIFIRRIGLLGDNNVELSRGTPQAQPVNDGGIIQGHEAGDIERVIKGANDVMANFQLLSDKVVKISEGIDRGEGTLGKLLTNSEIHDNLNNTVLEAKNLVRDIRTGSGTAGKLISDDEVYGRVNGLLARIDAVIDKVDHGDGTIGRFMNDPSVFNKIDQLIAKVDRVTDRIERGEGTLGKLSKDEAFYNDARAAVNRVNGLIAAIENGDGTAGKLIKDPTLFNSLTQSASEVQKLLYDLRQDPKKYLTINFRLF